MEADHLLNYESTDFNYPEKLNPELLRALDRFTETIGRKGTILSDWRDYDPVNPNSKHFTGDAIDVTFPGTDSVAILHAAQESGLFDGIGIYLNEVGAVSFHFDKRKHPARWGAFITPAVDPDTGESFRKYEYTTLDRVLDRVTLGLTSIVEAVAETGGEAIETVVEEVKKKPTTALVLVLLGVALLLSRK